MNPRTKMLLIVGGALLVLVLLLRRGTEDRSAPVAERKPEKKVRQAESPKARPRGQMAARPAVVDTPPEVRNTSAGLRTVAYAEGPGGKPMIKLRVATKGVCHPGDFEALEYTVGKGGNVLLTLEPISKTKKVKAKPVTKSLALSQIQKGVMVDLPVDRERGGVYGVFICTDDDGKGRCQDKQPADFNRILAKIGGTAAKNAIYYFQFMALRPESSLVYSGTASGVGSASERLADQGFTEKELEEGVGRRKG